MSIAEVIQTYRDKIENFEKDIAEIEDNEREEKEMIVAEKQMNRASKKLDPAAAAAAEGQERVWFQTPNERRKEKGKI